jgi:hypothetical protein
MSHYVAPEMKVIGSFFEVTRGVWFGNNRDTFGGRTPFDWDK